MSAPTTRIAWSRPRQRTEVRGIVRGTIYLRDRAAFLDIVADVLREHAERMEVQP